MCQWKGLLAEIQVGLELNERVDEPEVVAEEPAAIEENDKLSETEVEDASVEEALAEIQVGLELNERADEPEVVSRGQDSNRTKQ